MSHPVSQGESIDRNIGKVGVLIDGVEITSPESTDSVFYGPIDKFEVLNGGKGYSVTEPPKISITGAGTTALVEPVVQGIVEEVLVDPQDFDVDDVLSVTLKGLNGDGCVLKPVLGKRFREIEFDCRRLELLVVVLIL